MRLIHKSDIFVRGGWVRQLLRGQHACCRKLSTAARQCNVGGRATRDTLKPLQLHAHELYRAVVCEASLVQLLNERCAVHVRRLQVKCETDKQHVAKGEGNIQAAASRAEQQNIVARVVAEVQHLEELKHESDQRRGVLRRLLIRRHATHLIRRAM